MKKVAGETLDSVERVLESTGQGIEKTVAPVRENLIKRFPVLFMLLTTFGFTATIVGIEQILIQYDVLQSHPFIIFWLGIVTLAVTGTLYKKLG